MFCAIGRGDEPAFEVHRDDRLVAFLDTNPVFHGHVLLVPREHMVTLDELPDDLDAHWTATAKRLVRAVTAGMASQGSLVIVNNIVSQTVPHLHLHVIPRTRGDGLRFWLGPRHPYESDAQAEEVAARIREALAGA